MTDFVKGEEVSWNTPQGKTQGKVTKKITKDTTISSHQVKASSDNPQYEVQSNKSGKTAAHKPESLSTS